MKDFMKDSFDSYCGLECATCPEKKLNNCSGCIVTKGQPFYGSCDIVECIKERNKRFCGECENFPCELLKKYSFDKEHGDNGERIERCKTIKSDMVKTARMDLDPIGYCGHHCDFCFLGEWCGGCKSDYNSCSYATISENGICANVKCATEKGLENCSFCNDLLLCKKGFYQTDAVYSTKAKALFYKNYSKDFYTKTLKKAMNDKTFEDDFNKSESIESAYEILKGYIK